MFFQSLNWNRLKNEIPKKFVMKLATKLASELTTQLKRKLKFFGAASSHSSRNDKYSGHLFEFYIC